MRRYRYVMLIVLLLVMTTGCGQSVENEMPVFPEVQFTFTNTEVTAGEPVLFDAFVSAEGEPIVDADRVSFEVWHEDEEEGTHEDILIDHAGDGHYQLEKTFDTPGTHFIYYHVDTMGLHLMEKFEFVVK